MGDFNKSYKINTFDMFFECHRTIIPTWYLKLPSVFYKVVSKIIYIDDYYVVNEEGLCCLTNKFLLDLNEGKWNNKSIPNPPKEALKLDYLFCKLKCISYLDLSKWDITLDTSKIFKKFYSVEFDPSVYYPKC